MLGKSGIAVVPESKEMVKELGVMSKDTVSNMKGPKMQRHKLSIRKNNWDSNSLCI